MLGRLPLMIAALVAVLFFVAVSAIWIYTTQIPAIMQANRGLWVPFVFIGLAIVCFLYSLKRNKKALKRR